MNAPIAMRLGKCNANSELKFTEFRKSLRAPWSIKQTVSIQPTLRASGKWLVASRPPAET